jgi:O-antigen/teichoic acid export membrane protein
LLLLTPFPLLMLPASALTGCLMAQNRTAQVAGFNVGSRVLMLLAIVVPCLLWPRPSTAVYGLVLGAAVTTAVALMLMFRACDAGSWHPTIAGIARQIRFSVPLGLATLTGTVSAYLDQIMVAASSAPAVFAVYVNGAIEIPLIGMVTGSVTPVLLVDYVRLYKESKLSEIIALIHRAMVKCALILFPAMVFLMCMAPELMRAMFGPSYEASAIPFRIYLLMLPVRILNFGAVLQATNQSRRILFSALIALTTNALLLWCVIRLFGPLYAPLGPVVSQYCLVVPYLMFAAKSALRCSVNALFPWAELGKVLAASAIGVPAVLLLKYVSGWPNAITLACGGLIYAAITVVVFLEFGWRDAIPWRDWTGRLKVFVAARPQG